MPMTSNRTKESRLHGTTKFSAAQFLNPSELLSQVLADLENADLMEKKLRKKINSRKSLKTQKFILNPEVDFIPSKT